ncbi:MAG: hypothetical protein QOF02_596 [Blastocatellia bacterium]|jgi:hypothetical protein|nr:hypothetical protein [Blastocatellia bacterium]
MIQQRLLQRATIGSAAGLYLAGAHLDEDALSSFIEGRLSERESGPIVSHLVGCNSCRRFTAELMRLESEVGDVEAIAPPVAEEPGRIRRLLEDLAARVLPASDEVFAYHAPADDFEPKPDAEDEERAAAHEASEPEDEKNH